MSGRIKILLVLGIILVLVITIWQILFLRRAHSSFENYYVFRGCAQLLEKTDSYGICKLKSGQMIKIVKYDNRWFLDGDLPWACIHKVCFGL
ncbi:MAG: hypothetical protein WCG01_04885 [bacterium]